MSQKSNQLADVSVLLAVRDGMPFLKDAVMSVLNQVGATLELIIVDDGSNDAGVSWLEALEASDDRVRIIRNESSKGLTCALNQAIELAHGSYIARIDHDDLWLPGKLARQIQEFQRHADVVLVATGYNEQKLNGGELRPSGIPVIRESVEIRRALYRCNPFLHSSVMLKASIVDRIGGYNESFRYAQDYEMWTRILIHGEARTIPDVLCTRRLGDQNISIRKERAQRFNALRSKLSWCVRNGFSNRVVMPALRDILVMILPRSVKSVARRRLRIWRSK